MGKTPYRLAAAALATGLILGFLATVGVVKSGLITAPATSDADLPLSPGHETALTAAATTPLAPEMVPVTPDPPEEDLAGAIMVSVCGAVKQGGTYRFKPDSRVQDGIQAAGGLLEEAEMGDINIAARLMDNTTLYIPFQVYARQDGRSLVARRTATAVEMNPGRYTRSGWTGASRVDLPLPAVTASSTTTASVPETPPLPPATLDSNRQINLNTASSSELQQLPGIGPKTAEKIIAYRQQRHFKQVDELMEVSGIGDKKLEAVRDLVTVE